MAWNQRNWRRGLFRLWLVASAFWIAGMLVFVVPVGWTQNIFAAITNPSDPAMQRYLTSLPFTVFVLAGPPAVAAFLFWAAGWIARGFK